MRQVPEGAKVKFHHQRVPDPEIAIVVLPRGGRTVCEIVFPDGRSVYGFAECSTRDNYSKRIGRDIALGRALKTAENDSVVIEAGDEPKFDIEEN